MLVLRASSTAAWKSALCVEVVFHRLFKLRGTHAVGLLDGIFHREVLVQDQAKVSACFGQFLLVEAGNA